MNKNVKTILGLFVAAILLAGAFAGGFLAGNLLPSTPIRGLNDLLPSSPSASPDGQSATPAELQTLFAPFWEAWNIVHEQYVNQPVDDLALMQGAIRGMMDALGDKQTFYMEPLVYQTETSSLQGEYEGIGAYVDTDGDYLTIVSPIAGSPADLAGIRPGDKVVAIDGEEDDRCGSGGGAFKGAGPGGVKSHFNGGTRRRA